jgi:peptide/nickel transport system permease protein
MILFPGTFLALTVLAVNLVGDGLRDMLDPRFARRL